MTSRWAAVGLVCLLVVAGCSGSTTEQTRTVAPELEGTPSATPTPTVERPPGVSNETVDVDRLSSVHRAQLRAQSRTVRRETTIRGSDGALLGRSSTLVEASRERDGSLRVIGETAGAAPTTVGLANGSIDFWTNGTVVASRRMTTEGTGYSYRRPPLPPGPLADTTGHNLVEFAFQTVTTTRVERLGDGRLRIRGSADAVEDRRNISVVATVTSDGVVRRLQMSFRRQFDNRSVRVVRTLRVSRLGETTVPTPDWLPVARNASDTPTDSISTGDTPTDSISTGDTPTDSISTGDTPTDSISTLYWSAGVRERSPNSASRSPTDPLVSAPTPVSLRPRPYVSLRPRPHVGG